MSERQENMLKEIFEECNKVLKGEDMDNFHLKFHELESVTKYKKDLHFMFNNNDTLANVYNEDFNYICEIRVKRNRKKTTQYLRNYTYFLFNNIDFERGY